MIVSEDVFCQYSRMEPLSISVLSVLERDGHVRVRARATAVAAIIHLEVRFVAQHGVSKRELWQMARDQILRYLDPE